MIGRRLPDGDFPELPGDYAKMSIAEPDGGHVEAWILKSPDGGPVFIIGKPNSDGSPYHWVRENDDGTITVEADPLDAPPERRNSNSILTPLWKGTQWHGYIHAGEWRRC